MIKQTALLALLTLFLTGQAMTLALPIRLSMGTVDVARRSPEPLRTIPVYVKRQIPAEQAVKAPNGVIVPFTRRQIPEEESAPDSEINGRQIPEELATRTASGRIDTFTRRQIPAEQAVKAPNGVIVPFTRRQEVPSPSRRQIPAEEAVKAPNGVIVPFNRRQIAEEQDPYVRRQIPAEQAVKAPNGVIVPF
jgi:hypothetical protein